MRTPGERTSGAWTGGCAIHPDGGDETDRTAGNSYTATPHNTQGANSGQVLLQPYGEPVTDCRAKPTWRDGLFEKLQEYDADLIICDESQRIKTHDAEQSKAIHKLGDQARYKLILSGTPVQNDAIDIWSQYRFLDASIFGRNFYQFRNRYAIMGGFNRNRQCRIPAECDERNRRRKRRRAAAGAG